MKIAMSLEVNHVEPKKLKNTVLMKTPAGTDSSTTVTPETRYDSAKLVSLLALAAGATVMPQTVNGDIIVTDLGANPARVGFTPGFSSAYYFDNLPGDANGAFGFRATLTTNTITMSYFPYFRTVVYRTVTAGRQLGTLAIGLQTAAGFVVPQSAGAAWNTFLNLWWSGYVGRATTSYHLPPSGYSHKYLGWVFQDTTQAGSPLLSGWVEVSLSIANNIGPDVTIYRYAYDNTPGNLITMGAVPEPAPMTLLAFGALTFGAKGVRAWRRNRTAARQA